MFGTMAMECRGVNCDGMVDVEGCICIYIDVIVSG